jgi:hypothetical protein
MNRLPLSIALLLSVPLPVLSQTINHAEVQRFIRAILWNQPSLSAWFDPDEVVLADRLGIEYDGVKNKNLIGCDFDDSTKGLVRTGRVGYDIKIDTLDGAYARLTLTFENGASPRQYYFKGNHYISPEAFYARTWTVVETGHFRFILSDSTLSNPYCREQLEMFVARMGALLQFSARDMETLHEKKILYYLCKNEDEIQRLTGFRLRGMCDLAIDAVVSTYNTHCHELLHLLINYKLRHLPLYTHPLFQEGFAVAYGGRGGLAPDVLLSLGRFLYRSRSVELTSLFDDDNFRQCDPSLSYPAAGLYNRFLVETVGMESYLRLYRLFSRSQGEAAGVHIPAEMLPGDSIWNHYLRGSTGRNAITLDTAAAGDRVLFENGTGRVSEDGERYFFLLSRAILWSGAEKFASYASQAFRDAFPKKHYRGEKYMIVVRSEEVSVYNLFTNNLIASYAAPFAMPPARVPLIKDRYRFTVERRIFDEPLNSIRPSPDD